MWTHREKAHEPGPEVPGQGIVHAVNVFREPVDEPSYRVCVKEGHGQVHHVREKISVEFVASIEATHGLNESSKEDEKRWGMEHVSYNVNSIKSIIW